MGETPETERDEASGFTKADDFTKGTAAAPVEAPQQVFTFPHQRAPVTWTLSAVIAAVFVLEMVLGGPDQLWLMVRMGAVTPTTLETGELWRLLSSSFLHGNFAHVGFALMILWSLGGFIEKVLGSARMLILYVSAALAGGVAALLFGGGAIMVGSSGALWGLMVGHAMLAYRPNGLLPDALAEAMKAPAKKNLALNVFVSFLPGVSLAAHAGGALAGLVLMGTGLLTRGLKREAPEPTRPLRLGHGDEGARAPGPLLLGAAGLSGLLLALSLPVALISGEALSLRAAPEQHSFHIAGTGLVVDVPSTLGDPSAAPTGETMLFGDFLQDPFVVEIFPVTGLPTVEARRAAVDEISVGVTQSLQAQGWTLKDSGAQGAKRAAMAQEAAARQGKAIPLGERRFEAPNGVRLDMYLMGSEDAVVRLDVVRWPDLGAPWDSLARELPQSLRVAE